MAGDQQLRQDDIEELLRQAQAAAGVVEPAAPPPGPAASVTSVPPPQAAQPEPEPEPRPAAVATATLPPEPARRPTAGQVGTGQVGTGQVGDDIQYLLAQAEQAIASVNDPIDPAIEKIQPFEFKDLAGSPPSGEKATLELLKDVDLDLRIELGRTQMYLEDVLKLRRGSVVALDKLAGDPVDVYVNGRMVARGEVLVLNDNFCVRVTELLAGDDFE